MNFGFIEIPYLVKGVNDKELCYFDWNIIFMDRSYTIPTKEEIEKLKKVHTLNNSLNMFCTYEELIKKFGERGFLDGNYEMEEVYLSFRFSVNLHRKRVGLRDLKYIRTGVVKFLSGIETPLEVNFIPVKELYSCSYSLFTNDSDTLIDYVHFNKNRLMDKIIDIGQYCNWFSLFYILKVYYEKPRDSTR